MKVISYKEEKEDDEEMQEITNECIHPQKSKKNKKNSSEGEREGTKKRKIYNNAIPSVQKKDCCVYI